MLLKKTLFASAVLAAAGLAPMAAQAAYDAAAMYQLRCGYCHGDRGQGTRATNPPLGPALRANPFVTNGSPAAIRQVIRKGRQGEKRLYNDAYPNMPAFGAEAVEDVDALVGYLKGDLQK
jgi:mono/diheme cytochrome c family protein